MTFRRHFTRAARNVVLTLAAAFSLSGCFSERVNRHPPPKLPKDVTAAISMFVPLKPVPWNEDNPYYLRRDTDFSLTRAEQKFLKQVFGNLLHPDKMHLRFTGAYDGASGYAAGADTTLIHFTSRFYMRDYASELGSARGLLAHETIHLLQNMHKLNYNHKIGEKVYGYTLTPTSKMEDFGVEQQAAIMEDYTRRFLFPKSTRVVWTGSKPEEAWLLKTIIEKKFPGTQKLRLKYEDRRFSNDLKLAAKRTAAKAKAAKLAAKKAASGIAVKPPQQ